MPASPHLNVKFHNQNGLGNKRYAYAPCKRCLQPSLVLDFGKGIMFCTHCHDSKQMPREMIEGRLKQFVDLKLAK